jgi:hypothetical protein
MSCKNNLLDILNTYFLINFLFVNQKTLFKTEQEHLRATK